MQINLIAVGNKMPDWVKSGYEEYAKRLPSDYQLHLIEIPAFKRTKNSPLTKIAHQESEKILAASKPSCPVIALDRQGQSLSTQKLMEKLSKWHDLFTHINLLIGGPEGLSEIALQKSHEVWSLSCLTFPHPLVRVILAEQIYRAWSMVANHPYHRL